MSFLVSAKDRGTGVCPHKVTKRVVMAAAAEVKTAVVTSCCASLFILRNRALHLAGIAFTPSIKKVSGIVWASTITNSYQHAAQHFLEQ